MAIRLRKVQQKWIALCAVETDPQEDDIYLDDAQDHALRAKFMMDYLNECSIDLGRDTKFEKLMATQKMRDAKKELLQWLNTNNDNSF